MRLEEEGNIGALLDAYASALSGTPWDPSTRDRRVAQLLTLNPGLNAFPGRLWRGARYVGYAADKAALRGSAPGRGALVRRGFGIPCSRQWPRVCRLLPPIEALPEVLGDAGVLVDPTEAEQIAGYPPDGYRRCVAKRCAEWGLAGAPVFMEMRGDVAALRLKPPSTRIGGGAADVGAGHPAVAVEDA